MNINFAPGPSQLYPKAHVFIQDALDENIMSLSHRTAAFRGLYAGTQTALRELLNIPPDHHIWFMGSATEAMERTIQNTVRQRSHHFVGGAFGARFAQVASMLGKELSTTQSDWGHGFDLDNEAVPDDAELIAVTHNETSTGVVLDPASIARLHDRYPDKLLAVDIVSSVPHVEIDFSRVDIAFFSVQKGLGLPAGLGVLVASPRALERARELNSEGRTIGSYHRFLELDHHGTNFHTPETPNVLGIYLLSRVAQDLLDRGIAGVRRQITDQAAGLYQALSDHPHFAPLVAQPMHRSNTVVVAEVQGGSGPLMDSLSAKGIHLGSGYGPQKETHIRIANFPAHLGHTDHLLAQLAQHFAPII